MTNKNITVREYEKISLSSVNETTAQGENYTCELSQADFDYLNDVKEKTNDFLKWYYGTQETDKKPPKLVELKDSKTLTIQNYVGMIKLPSGAILEILPKVQIVPENDNENKDAERQKLIQMICTTIAPRLSDNSFFDDNKNNLMEYLIAWFLHHMDRLLKQGVKQNYVMTTEKAHFIKGKILFAPDIKFNSAMRHRTYIEYEDYTPDCPENRLLHSALWACVKHSNNADNKNLANRYCHMFDSIGKSTNYDKDFTHWKLNHMYPAYDEIRPITELILYGIQPFMSEGSHKAPTILFPMHIVYEKYIANCLEQHPTDYNVDPQNTDEYLTKSKAFNLRPDILLTPNSDNTEKQNIILDTKWKKYKNIGSIDSSDAYQMFAYSQAHNADTILLYPRDHTPKDSEENNKLEENNTSYELFKHGYKKDGKEKILKTHITDLSQEPATIAKNIIKAI